MSFSLTSNFLRNARGVTFTDGGGITWSFNANTNSLTANGSGAGAAGASPTAKVGLAAVNGSAGTFMRSDGAPPLDQSIVPTWTGAHTFAAPASTVAITITSAAGTNGFNINGTDLVAVLLNAGVSTANRSVINFKQNGGSASHVGLDGGNALLSDSTNGDFCITAGSGALRLGVSGSTTAIKLASGNVTLSGEFAINGGTPTAALSGFGSPSGSVTSGLTSSATLAQTAGTLAALLAYLKTIGVIAA